MILRRRLRAGGLLGDPAGLPAIAPAIQDRYDLT
jgi:hypothetical protein